MTVIAFSFTNKFLGVLALRYKLLRAPGSAGAGAG